ncbi:MAG TPA: hypothetical protein VNM48_02820 [Chloroflexota bacterium]|nr:hypothetical protein [Chloroflexota bacterium]
MTAGAKAAGAKAAAGRDGLNESGPLPVGAEVKVLVEYVDDRGRFRDETDTRLTALGDGIMAMEE